MLEFKVVKGKISFLFDDNMVEGDILVFWFVYYWENLYVFNIFLVYIKFLLYKVMRKSRVS